MIKEFPHHVAWTDAMADGGSFVGLIEYQRKLPFSCVHILWVINPAISDQIEAELSAIKMLEKICRITDSDTVVYDDGVAL